jgi:hypothetical protein
LSFPSPVPPFEIGINFSQGLSDKYLLNYVNIYTFNPDQEYLSTDDQNAQVNEKKEISRRMYQSLMRLWSDIPY